MSDKSDKNLKPLTLEAAAALRADLSKELNEARAAVRKALKAYSRVARQFEEAIDHVEAWGCPEAEADGWAAEFDRWDDSHPPVYADDALGFLEQFE